MPSQFKFRGKAVDEMTYYEIQKKLIEIESINQELDAWNSKPVSEMDFSTINVLRGRKHNAEWWVNELSHTTVDEEHVWESPDMKFLKKYCYSKEKKEANSKKASADALKRRQEDRLKTLQKFQSGKQLTIDDFDSVGGEIKREVICSYGEIPDEQLAKELNMTNELLYAIVKFLDLRKPKSITKDKKKARANFML